MLERGRIASGGSDGRVLIAEKSSPPGMREEIQGELVVFSLDAQRYGLPLPSVSRVVRVVAVTPLSEAPPIVLGVIDLEGAVTPVVGMRARCGHAARDVRLYDHLIIASTGRRMVALLVDETHGVISPAPGAIADAEEILPDLGFVAGAVKLDDRLILIHDLGRLLSLDEEAAVERALASASSERSP